GGGIEHRGPDAHPTRIPSSRWEREQHQPETGVLMSLPEPTPIREYHDVDAARFRDEIRPLGQPAVLRGYAADWPAVQAALRSDEAVIDYVRAFRVERPVQVLVGTPAIAGRFFYTDDLRGFN